MDFGGLALPREELGGWTFRLETLRPMTWMERLQAVVLASVQSSSAKDSPKPSSLVTELDWADVQSVLEGKQESFRRLVERHQQSIASFLWKFTRDPLMCEELTQEAFVQAYYSLPTFRGQGSFPAWMKKIAARVGYRFWKLQAKRRQTQSLEDVNDPAATGANPTDANDAATEVHSLLARLKPRDRLVLTLMYLEEKSVEEIAELIGWSRAMVKVQAFRARRKLKVLLEARREKS